MRMTRQSWTVLIFSALLVALAAAATPSSAQSPDERIRTTLERAAEAGIPTSLLQSKLAEGRAKGISEERIAPALDRRLDGLVRAGEILSEVPRLREADLDLGADALESGVSEAVLAEIATTAAPHDRSAAIAALGHLVPADIAPEDALERVRNALDRGRGPATLEDLPGFAPGPAGPSGPGELPRPGDVPGPGVGPSGVDGSDRPPVQPAFEPPGRP